MNNVHSGKRKMVSFMKTQERIYLIKVLHEHRIDEKESLISSTVYTKAPILTEGEKNFPKPN